MKKFIVCCYLVLFAGCGGASGGGSSSSSSSGGGLPDPSGGGGLTAVERSVEAFSTTVYPIVRTHCVACHGNSQLSFLPQFANQQLESAHAVARGLVNFSTISNSLFLRQLNSGHNCWSDCSANAAAMENAILQWYAAINDIVDSGDVPVLPDPINIGPDPINIGTTRTDYENTGDYAVTSQSGGSSCTIFSPSRSAETYPVILWGNGTGASPTSYRSLLRHWASWGFVVAAANTTNAGTGQQMIACLDWLESSNLSSAINFAQVGTSGHSQGGGGAIMAGTDPRVTTTAPIEGYTLGLGHDSSSWTQQHGPMLLLSGGNDGLVSPSANHGTVFRRTNVPVFWAELAGASHFEPVGDGGGFRGITTAWFLYTLKNNRTAAGFFEGSNCGFCSQSRWQVQKKDLP